MNAPTVRFYGNHLRKAMNLKETTLIETDKPTRHDTRIMIKYQSEPNVLQRSFYMFDDSTPENNITPDKLQLLHIFDHIDKLPPFKSPEYRLLHIDEVIYGERVDSLNDQLKLLSDNDIIRQKLTRPHGKPCLLIQLRPTAIRWRSLVVRYLHNN